MFLPGIIVQSDFHHRRVKAPASFVAKDIAEAKTLYAPDADWAPEGVALFAQSVIQGAFILAKSRGNAKVAADAWITYEAISKVCSRRMELLGRRRTS